MGNNFWVGFLCGAGWAGAIGLVSLNGYKTGVTEAFKDYHQKVEKMFADQEAKYKALIQNGTTRIS